MSKAAVQSSPAPAKPGFVHMVLDRLDRAILAAWGVFKSLKFGIFLLAVIGAICVYGTMYYAANPSFGDNQIPLARARVFNTWWFSALLMLFAIQLIVSTWHVSVMSVTIWWKREFRRSETFYKPSRTPRAEVVLPGGMDAALPALRREFPRFFHRDGNALFAHAGLLSRLGPTIVHVGMLTVLGAGMVRAYMFNQGMIVSEGRFIAAEGETSNLIHEPRIYAQAIGGANVTDRPIPNGKAIRVLDFDEIQHPNAGSPAYFSSLIEIIDESAGTVRVVQLDMNHAVRIDGLQYHQAGYDKVEDPAPNRWLFDVRRAEADRRLATTDTSIGIPARVGQSDYYLVVDGAVPGATWRIFHRERPTEVYAYGTVEATSASPRYLYVPKRFYTHFRINPTTNTPENGSKELVNPALEIATMLDDRETGRQFLFLDPALAARMPEFPGRYRFQLKDVEVALDRPVSEIDWSSPGDARFIVEVLDRTTSTVLRQDRLMLTQPSPLLDLASEPASPSAAPESAKDFRVVFLGPTQRYLTVLSVVSEPTVPYTTLGVGIILLGAVMTFASRYRALYGYYDEATSTLRLALLPRWSHGIDAARADMARLAEALAKVPGATVRVLPNVSTGPVATDESDDTTIAAPQATTT